MNKKAKVSLYIPCYNAEKYIKECLEAVLKQTFAPDEILIIDDGSKDNTIEIASRYLVKIIKHKQNMGLASARNTAFKNAKNEYVAAIDADCIPAPNWLEIIMTNFSDENISGVGGKLIEKFGTVGSLADRWRAVHMSQDHGNKKLYNILLNGSNVVFKKKSIEIIGFFNENYKTNYEDMDICTRLLKKNFKLVYEPQAVAYHLRRDSIFSVLETYWRWGHSHKQINNIKIILNIIKIAIETSISIGLKDIRHHRFSFLIIDLILLFYHPLVTLNRKIKLKINKF